MPDTSPEPKNTTDLAIILDRQDDGRMLIARVQGTDDGPVRAMLGVVTPVVEGAAITNEVIHLTPSDTSPYCRVETMVADPYKAERDRARVSSGRTFSFPSQKYQDNWEGIFGMKPRTPEVN